MEDFVLQPPPQQLFELPLEIIGGAEIVAGGLEMSLLGQEPRIKKILQPLPLFMDLPRRRVVEADRWRLGMTEHENIGKWVLAPRRHRGQHFIGGAAWVGAAIRLTLEIWRQFGAETTAKNCDDNVTFVRGWNLRLEGCVRLIELSLPTDCLETYSACEVPVQARDDAVHSTALMIDVAGRRDKNAEMFHYSFTHKFHWLRGAPPSAACISSKRCARRASSVE